jgi:hypothetical protein
VAARCAGALAAALGTDHAWAQNGAQPGGGISNAAAGGWRGGGSNGVKAAAAA